MSLTAKDVAEIVRLLDESAFSSLDLEVGEFRLRLRRGGAASAAALPTRTVVPAKAEPSADAADGHGPHGDSAPGPGEHDVPAPLLGNFYSAPRPGEPPFVEPGDTVGPDTTIGIIEVMKLMNPIRAGVSGTVVAILAENGKAVEEGQPLVRVRVG